jgi:hypothetical protein
MEISGARLQIDSEGLKPDLPRSTFERLPKRSSTTDAFRSHRAHMVVLGIFRALDAVLSSQFLRPVRFGQSAQLPADSTSCESRSSTARPSERADHLLSIQCDHAGFVFQLERSRRTLAELDVKRSASITTNDGVLKPDEVALAAQFPAGHGK